MDGIRLYGRRVLQNELSVMVILYSMVLFVTFLPVVLGHQTMDAINSMPGVLGHRFLPPGNGPFSDPAAAGPIEDPLNVLVARDWSRGQIPFWDPYAGFGMPLAANAQTAAWFFPEIIAHILLPHQAWSMYNLLRILAACVGAFWLGRLTRLSLVAAFFGGLLYGLSGAMLPNQAMNLCKYHGHVPVASWGRYVLGEPPRGPQRVGGRVGGVDRRNHDGRYARGIGVNPNVWLHIHCRFCIVGCTNTVEKRNRVNRFWNPRRGSHGGGYPTVCRLYQDRAHCSHDGFWIESESAVGTCD